jgi:predicted transcriptional regulator
MKKETPSHTWRASTDAFERVKSVVVSFSTPSSIQTIAEEACVSEETARECLQRLQELNVVKKHSGSSGEVCYLPDPVYLFTEQVGQIVRENTKDELVSLREHIQMQIEEWEEKYGVETPKELRKRAQEAPNTSKRRELKKDASDWEHALYQVWMATTVIENYDAYVKKYGG